MTDRQNTPVRIARLSDQGADDDLAAATADECIELMWQLTVDAWTIRGEPVDESRRLRHVVRVERRGS